MRPPFFIVGTQRSGTTLLYQMLNSHPELYLVNEFWDLYPHLTGEVRDPAALERLLVAHLGLTTSHLGGTGAPDEPFTHVDRAFEKRLEELGKSRWGIKHPRLTYYLDLFAAHYPEARFVVIVRDARGVNRSYLTRKMNVANVYHGARLWREQVGIQSEFMRRHPDVCHRLRFENLLAAPESRLRDICDFLGEQYSDHMLRYYRYSPDTSVHAGNVNITRPIQPGVADKWRTELSSRQIGIIEAIAGDTMVEHGYELTGAVARLGPRQRRIYDLHQWLLTTYWWQRRSGWSGLRKRWARWFRGR